MKKFTKSAGFSLIEVVISFAILASLGVVMIQSQLNSSRLIYNTSQADFVNSLIQKELQKIELQPQTVKGEMTGKFPDDFELTDAVWTITKTDDNILLVPMSRITYKITWTDQKQPRSASDFIIVEPPASILDDLLSGG